MGDTTTEVHADDWLDDEQEDTGWDAEARNVWDSEAKRPRLLAERCRTCILGGENSITPKLRAGRLKQLVEDAADGHVPCHSTLSNTDPHAAICRGWFEAFGMESNYIRVMGRLGGFHEVDPPAYGGASDDH